MNTGVVAKVHPGAVVPDGGRRISMASGVYNASHVRAAGEAEGDEGNPDGVRAIGHRIDPGHPAVLLKKQIDSGGADGFLLPVVVSITGCPGKKQPVFPARAIIPNFRPYLQGYQYGVGLVAPPLPVDAQHQVALVLEEVPRFHLHHLPPA